VIGKYLEGDNVCPRLTPRFALVETQVIEFNRIALQKEHMRTDDMFNRVASRDNIAVVASLEFIASGARLLAVNGHIFWDHHYRDVKVVQIGMLMEELEQIAERFSKLPPRPPREADLKSGRPPPRYDPALKGTDIPLVFCIDTNSRADSAVYDLITKGEIAADHDDFMDHAYGEYTRRGLKHRLNLDSACASFGEMKMTNFTPTFVAAIDYIFYTPSALKVTSVLGDVDKAYLDKTVGFPNAHFPSE
jgi:CCR4-NOT transcription complex subunit 6